MLRPPALKAPLLALAGALLLAGALALRRKRHRLPSDKSGAPLPQPPSTLPLLANSLDLVREGPRLHDWLCETSLRLGGRPWMLRVVGQAPIVILSSPAAIEDVERALFAKFSKGPHIRDFVFDLLGDGIVNADGDLWAFQRKAALGLFSSRALRESMADVVHRHAATLDAILEATASSQRELDVAELLHHFAMEAFTEIGFGLQLGCLGSDEPNAFEAAFDDAQHVIMTRMRLPVFVWKLQRLLGVGKEGHLKKCMQVVNDTVMGMVRQAVANNREARSGNGSARGRRKKDLVSLFLESEDAKGRLSPELLRDFALNLLLGGRDTTAETLSWMLYMLSRHPAVEHKVRQEIVGAFGSGLKASDRIATDELQNLTYLEAVLKETLRLYPPASWNMRYCNEDAVLSDGTFIPAGSNATICMYTTGRRTDVWGPDAAEFNPERWLDPTDPSKLIAVSAFKFNAFWGGPRMCIGMNLAMMEMKTVAVKVLSKFHLEVAPGQDVTYRHSITLPLKNGLLVRVHRV